jgi:hypothetical protein
MTLAPDVDVIKLVLALVVATKKLECLSLVSQVR